MDSEALEFSLSRCKDGEYLKWVSEAAVRPMPVPLDPDKVFIFMNPVTRKFTALPKRHIARNFLYFPTNSPGTGEHYVTAIFAVNGDYAVNYDEDENRFDRNFNYLSDQHKTRIDIYLNRMAVRKAERRSDEDESGQSQPNDGDSRRGEVQDPDIGA